MIEYSVHQGGKSSKGLISLCFLFFAFLIHTNLPIVGFFTPAMGYAGIVLLSYMVSINVMGVQRFIRLLISVFPLFLPEILKLIHHAISGQGDFNIEFYSLVQALIFPVFTLFLIENKGIKQAKWLMAIVILCCVITSITTYLGCLAFPNASRDLATTIRSDDNALYSTYMSLNIGGFAFIYKLVILIPIIIYFAKRRVINIVVSVFFVASYLLAIIKSEYTTALIFTFMGVMTVFLPVNMERKRAKKFIVISTIIGMALFSSVPLMLRYYASVTQSETVSTRLDDLSDVLSGDAQVASLNSDIGSRHNYFKMSLDSFNDSYMMGSWDKAYVGGHSYIFDMMGIYGLLGILLVIIMYSRLYKLFIKPYKNRPWYGVIMFVFIIALIQAIVNTGNNIAFMSLIFPLFSLLMEEPRNDLKTNIRIGASLR